MVTVDTVVMVVKEVVVGRKCRSLCGNHHVNRTTSRDRRRRVMSAPRTSYSLLVTCRNRLELPLLKDVDSQTIDIVRRCKSFSGDGTLCEKLKAAA